MPTALAAKTSSLADYQRYNPLRRPEWRYVRAKHLLDSTRPGAKPRITPADDAFIGRLTQFLRFNDQLLAKYGHDEDVLEFQRATQLFAKYPSLCLAHDLFVSADPELGGDAASHLEARLLCGMSDQLIAERMNLPPETVAWYEHCFYNVRDRLQNKSYLMRVIQFPPGNRRLPYMTICKLLACSGEPELLEPVLSHGDSSGCQELLDRQLETTIRLLALRAGLTAIPSERNTADLIAQYTTLLKAKAESELGGGGAGDLGAGHRDTIAAMLSCVPWSVGSAGKSAIADSPLLPYLEQPTELRADEMLSVAQGLRPALTVEQLRVVLTPPARKRSDHENDRPTDGTEPDRGGA